MGIWTDAELLVGWEIGYSTMVGYLKLYEAQTCHNDKTFCMCDNDCWKLDIPKGVTVRCTSPYFDCELSDRRIHITLINEKGKVPKNTTEVLAIQNDKEKYDKILEFVSKVTERLIDKIPEPTFYAAVHVM